MLETVMYVVKIKRLQLVLIIIYFAQN